MQGIVSKLISLVENKMKIPCLYNDWNRLNKDTDKLSKSISDKNPKFPAVYIVIPAQGSVDSRFGRFRQSSILTINFVIETLERADFEGIENESRIEEMKYLAIRFLYHFEKSRLFEPLTDIIEFRNLYMVTDNSLTGVSITIPVKELEGICFDDVEEEEDNDDDITDEIPTGYYILTAADATKVENGYYDRNEEWVDHHDYLTYTLPVLLDKGNLFQYIGFIDRPIMFYLPYQMLMNGNTTNPIQRWNYVIYDEGEIIITTRADVPFRVKLGTFDLLNFGIF